VLQTERYSEDRRATLYELKTSSSPYMQLFGLFNRLNSIVHIIKPASHNERVSEIEILFSGSAAVLVLI
jgi:hypothetical protein